MSIQLVAIDIDGTLLNSKRELTPRVIEAVKHATSKGIAIVLCTGRPLLGVNPLLETLELYKENDFVITYNGSLVQETLSKKIISQYGLSHTDFLAIDDMARQVGVHCHSIDHHAIYTTNRDIGKYTVHEAFLVDMPLKYRTREEMTADMNLVKMMMIDEAEILDQAIPRIPETFKEKYTTVKSAPFYYEILHKQASKGNALQQLATHLRLTPQEIMAIGDNENDLSMLTFAGTSVAMANATDAVKACATMHTASNDEDGVADILFRL